MLTFVMQTMPCIYYMQNCEASWKQNTPKTNSRLQLFMYHSRPFTTVHEPFITVHNRLLPDKNVRFEPFSDVHNRRSQPTNTVRYVRSLTFVNGWYRSLWSPKTVHERLFYRSIAFITDSLKDPNFRKTWHIYLYLKHFIDFYGHI